MTAVPVDLLREMLEQEGIPCVVRNRALSMTAGEVPPIETWPSLWVVDDAQVPQAQQLIAAVMNDEGAGEPWTCPQCGEEVDGHFAACWRCARPDLPEEGADRVFTQSARDYEHVGRRWAPVWTGALVLALAALVALALGLFRHG